MKIRVATRRSALALAQTRQLMATLAAAAPHLELEELHLVTEGDRVQDRSLSAIGGKGLFVRELEAALLEGRAELAVHSLKDLPAQMPEGLVLASVPPRESPWDLLLTREGGTVRDLPDSALVGSSSLRRRLQLCIARPDLRVELLRGNVDTRLRRLRDGDFDAIVLAEAGLRRLGLREQVHASSLEETLVPSIGQGALGLQCREDHHELRALLEALQDRDSRCAVDAERAALRELGGDCTTPVGVHAVCDGDSLRLRGFLSTREGDRWTRSELEGPREQAVELGARLARMLRDALG